MTTTTLGGFSTTVEADDRNAKTKMLLYEVKAHFVAKSGKEFNIRMSLHSLMRDMVDLERNEEIAQGKSRDEMTQKRPWHQVMLRHVSSDSLEELSLQDRKEIVSSLGSHLHKSGDCCTTDVPQPQLAHRKRRQNQSPKTSNLLRSLSTLVLHKPAKTTPGLERTNQQGIMRCGPPFFFELTRC